MPSSVHADPVPTVPHRSHGAAVPDSTSRRAIGWLPGVVSAGIAALALVFYVLIALGSFRGLALGQDLGIFDQAVAAYSRLQPPDIWLKAQGGFNILGDHFSPIVMVLAPFYKLWPSAVTLMIAQAALFAGCVLMVGRYAYRRGLGLASFLVEAAFAASYGLLSAMVFDFHETAFGLPILLWAVWGFLERRDGQLIAACVLMCLVKEDMPMYAAGLALALFFTGRKVFGLILGAASVVVTLLLVYVVIPSFSYWGHYTYIGSDARGLRSAGEALASLGQHLFSVHGMSFILMLAVTAGIGVVRPVMWTVVPTVVFRFMANDTTYLGFRFQYGVLLTGVAFLALIDAWSWLQTKPDRLVKVVRAGQALLLAGVAVFGFHESEAANRVTMLWTASRPASALDEVAAAIPDGASVAADAFLVDRIVDRTKVQVAFPTWTDETGAPIEADYVLLWENTTAYGNAATPWVRSLIQKLTATTGGVLGGSRRRIVRLAAT